ncbi:nicotinate-nucleotide--dimethylbenzimidazole phosphoribosyltransferase, partial [Klebsiella pneumoniae]
LQGLLPDRLGQEINLRRGAHALSDNPSHLSAEKGAQIALDALGLRPYLDMDMRLGEGSGAALAMHLLDAASVMYNQMGTLAQSNIVLPDSAPSS